MNDRRRDILEWDAAAKAQLAAFIRDYLDEHPAPAGSSNAVAMRVWARRLELGAERDRGRLASEEASHLRLV